MTSVCLLSGLTSTNSIQAKPNARHILVLNLMPNRAVTEQQFVRIFKASGQDVTLTFCLPSTHHLRQHTLALHRAYKLFNEVKDQYFDGLIITGAPLDQTDFADVDYWDELKEILDWRRSHVRSSLFLCWGALAAGHIEGDFEGKRLNHKIVGVYNVDGYKIPQSRYFYIPTTGISHGFVVAGNDELGACIIENPATHSTYVTGHFEYLPGTLASEYFRDRAKRGDAAPRPANYFNADMRPSADWSHDATQFYSDWLNAIPYESETLRSAAL
ncbi:homoserine O-succinyltransferase [Lacticaseibacillus pabuli]|uniref:Homoserine O-acetyltransferase n=1 Tax=Lacticaseibacillus pabuli TaxID=3025672 RepID=A0ABY7WQL3_9LACO|nr:homoserine O-succinyltransferase [Lacticaseibacillus sp. KACC 23028]WDF82487.1 homoserine O-succinyltransferase [Lacticaseibacillus sp. KACC 23028]